MPSLFQTLAAPQASKTAKTNNLLPPAQSSRPSTDSQSNLRIGGFKDMLGKSLSKSSAKPTTPREDSSRADRNASSKSARAESKKTTTRAKKSAGKKEEDDTEEAEPTGKEDRQAK